MVLKWRDRGSVCPCCGRIKSLFARACERCYHASLRGSRAIQMEDAIELFFSGVGFGEIGRRMGVSSARARELLLTHSRRLEPKGNLTRMLGVFVGHKRTDKV